MKLDCIRIILVATSHPGNIGSTARAMKTMGLRHLYLVTPEAFPHPHATELSAGADDILQQAIVCDTLEEALVGCHLIMATSARPRGLSLPGFLPAACAEKIAKEPDDRQIALVFGRERAGLTNAELLHCHFHVHIPADSEYSSLNLSQAVQIIAYELRMKILNPACIVENKQPDMPATSEEFENFMQHLRDVLINIQFLNPDNPRRLMERLRRLFTRIQLEKMEVNLLRGILTQTESAIRKKGV